MRRSAVVGLLVLGLLATVSSNAAAQGTLIQVALFVGNLDPNAPPLSLTVGVAEPGKGFGFVEFHDDNNDGIIQLPLVPVGSRLALGGDFGGGVEDCDIFVLVGSGIGGGAMIGREIVVPLLANADEGGAVGINFDELMAPPLTLTPGDRFTVMDGVLPAWPALRFVDVSGVPDLETFVPVVDTLPPFNGDVIVSNARLQFTFVPEPSSLVLLALATGCAGFITARRRVRS